MNNNDFHSEVINTAEAGTTAVPVRDFVLPGLRRGRVGALVSQSGLGKSMLALELCCAVVNADAAETLLGLDLDRHGPALYWSAEDDADEVRTRFHAIYARLSGPAQRAMNDHLHLASAADTNTPFNIMKPRWQEEILRVAQDSRLIVVDTLSCSYPAENENDNSEMRRPVEAFKQLARKGHASVLFLHHTPRTAQTGGAHPTPRGASVIESNSRYVSYLMPMAETNAKHYSVNNRTVDSRDAEDYVLWGVSKQTSGQRALARWLHRDEDGLLIPASVTRTGVAGKSKSTIASVNVQVSARKGRFDDEL